MLRPRLQPIVDDAIAAGVTPGAAIVAGAPERRAAVVFGYRDYQHDQPVAIDTRYDVASLTKPVVTAALAMRMIADGRLALDTHAVELLPELTSRGADAITIAHLLGHASGLPAHVELFRRLWASKLEGRAAYQALIAMAGEVPLEAPPGTRGRYSDLGYVLLGAALERIDGSRRLDRMAEVELFRPLGMVDSTFVDLAPDSLTRDVAHASPPTEDCPTRGPIRGEVHDENAHAAGGIAGHAGLFSSAADLARFAEALLAAAAGDSRGPFAPDVVRRFFATAAAPDTTWRLGWDTPDPAPGASQAGDRWPRDGVGHLAFTGCSLWLAPREQRYVVLLTNRVHPTRERGGIRELRRAVMDATAEYLEG